MSSLAPEQSFYDEMVEQYGRVKRFTDGSRGASFLSGCRWESTLESIHYLAELKRQRRFLDDAPEHIVKTSWKRLVYDGDGRIQRAGYSLCFLERLQDSLRRRDVWVTKSDRWGNPRKALKW